MFIRSIAVALVGVGLALPALAEPGVRVALLPIAVHASGSDSDYLEKGLSDMLSARLEQYGGIDVVRPGSDALPAQARDEAVAAGREVGADFVLYGSFTRFGEGASLDLRCARVEEPGERGEAPSSDARRVFIQAGTLADIIPNLDTLAEKVARYAISSPSSPLRRGEDLADAANGVPTPAEYQELLRRIEALERALYAPVAQGEPPANESDTDASASVVR